MATYRSRTRTERLAQTRVSAKGQTVIPSAIRRLLGIGPQTRLRWEVRCRIIVVYPVDQDPVAASQGALQELGVALSDFLEHRQVRGA